MAEVNKRIEELLESKFEGTDFYLVDLKLLPGNKLQIFIDSDSGITIEKCAEISRFLEFNIEEQSLLPETYTLEVSSPGVGQPLKYKRQYFKNIGRTVEVELIEGTKKSGKLILTDDDKIVIEEVKDPSKTVAKGKKPETKESEIFFKDIKQTKVTITF